MSFQAFRWVMERSQHKKSTLLVQVILADYANDEGLAWPSIETIGERAGLKRTAVDDALKKLRDSGDIVVEQQGGTAARPTSTVYRLQLLPGGVRQTGYEPAERTTRRDRSSSSSFSIDPHPDGSYPPERMGFLEQSGLPDEVTEEIRAVSKFFATELVRVGKKKPAYVISDAYSDEWLSQVYRLFFEQLERCKEMDLTFSELIKPVITHVIESELVSYVHGPRAMYGSLTDEAVYAVHADRMRPVYYDDTPVWDRPNAEDLGKTPEQIQEQRRRYTAETIGEPENWDSIRLGEPRKRRGCPSDSKSDQ